MIDEQRTKWKDLKDSYVLIKNIGKFNLPTDIGIFIVVVPSNVLVLDADDKRVTFRLVGNKGELHCIILKDGVLKNDVGLFSHNKYKFVRELTEWEKLEFEVADYIGGFYDELDSDFDSKIKEKSKEKCKYMQKSANFVMEQCFPIKSIGASFLGLIFFSEVLKTNADVWLALIFGSAIYFYYYQFRKRYTTNSF